MVIGYDVHHQKRSKSTMAFNASVDRNFCQQWHTVVYENECQEFGTKLEETLKKALKVFMDKNNTVPPKVLFILRDGVGDSQK